MFKSIPKTVWDFFFIVMVMCYAIAVDRGILDISAGGAVIDSDLNVYAQGMARIMHPDAFAADPVLYSITQANTIWNLQRWLAECFASPDAPAAALLHTGAITVFCWFSGFYILGRWLFGRPILAALTSLLMGITIYIEWGTFWGVLHSDPVPRVLYGALWPFLLMGCLAAVQKTWLRPLVMLATGASMWIHAVNALNCGAMFFMAFLCFRPSELTMPRHLIQCAGNLILYFIPVIIFLWPSIAPKSFTADEFSIFHKILDMRWQEDYGYLLQRLWHLIEPLHEFSILWLLVPGLLAWLVIFVRGKGRVHLLACLCPHFLLALFLVVCFSAAEGSWSHATGRLPLGHELVRGLRYLIPLSWLLIVGMIATLLPEDKPGILGRVLPVAVTVLALLLFCKAQDRQNIAAQHYISQLTGFSLPLESEALTIKKSALSYREAIMMLGELVPFGEGVFSEGEDMAIRHLAQRPLIYCFKDGSTLYYTRNADDCRKWLARAVHMEQAKRGNLVEIVDLWLESGARWFLFHNNTLIQAVQANGASIVWQNGNWYIARRNS